jgi:hypothetical protein
MSLKDEETGPSPQHKGALRAVPAQTISGLITTLFQAAAIMTILPERYFLSTRASQKNKTEHWQKAGKVTWMEY